MEHISGSFTRNSVHGPISAYQTHFNLYSHQLIPDWVDLQSDDSIKGFSETVLQTQNVFIKLHIRAEDTSSERLHTTVEPLYKGHFE